MPEELGQTLSQVQGVKQVVGGLVDTLTFREKNLKSVLININGWPAHCPWLERLKVQFGGRSLIAGNERKAIVGKDLAAKLEKQVGDKIELYGDEQFEIVGIYESPIQLENNGLVVPLGELQRLMNSLAKLPAFRLCRTPDRRQRPGTTSPTGRGSSTRIGSHGRTNTCGPANKQG